MPARPPLRRRSREWRILLCQQGLLAFMPTGGIGIYASRACPHEGSTRPVRSLPARLVWQGRGPPRLRVPPANQPPPTPPTPLRVPRPRPASPTPGPAPPHRRPPPPSLSASQAAGASAAAPPALRFVARGAPPPPPPPPPAPAGAALAALAAAGTGGLVQPQVASLEGSYSSRGHVRSRSALPRRLLF